MEKPEFKPGDIVRLKCSEHPKMVVEFIDYAGMHHCYFATKKGSVKRIDLRKEALQFYKNP